MVPRRLASLYDALPSLDRRVVERLDSGDTLPKSSALDIWSEYPPINIHGNVRTGAQFRVLAFVVRRCVAGPRSHRQMHVRHRLSAFALTARRRRSARAAGDSSTWAAAE